jgi:hypothetical protein
MLGVGIPENMLIGRISRFRCCEDGADCWGCVTELVEAGATGGEEAF